MLIIDPSFHAVDWPFGLNSIAWPDGIFPLVVQRLGDPEL